MCIPSPGWQHGWDLILLRGLRGLKWFPAWLDGMRALVSFFRAKLMLNSFCAHLERLQFGAIAEMLRGTSIPSIAEWRWSTLFTAYENLSKVLSTFATHFDSSLFRNSKDPKLISRVSKAIASEQWMWQFQVALWFSRCL